VASCRFARALVFIAALSSTGCRFGIGGLHGVGAAADLAGSDGTVPDLAMSGGGNDLAMSVAPDLASAVAPDLAMSVADLAVARPDLATACSPPSIGSTVGPGPNLAITLKNVKLNNGSNFTHLAAGATFTVKADYALTDGGNNIDQILVGIGVPSTALACLFDATVSGGGANGTSTVTLTAPTTPGTYTLRFHYGQDYSCNLSWWTVNGAPTAATDFAAFCVP
jgi:hypothetical protein